MDPGSDGRGHHWTDSSSVDYCTGYVDQADGRGLRVQEEPWADGCVNRALFSPDEGWPFIHEILFPAKCRGMPDCFGTTGSRDSQREGVVDFG